MAVSQVPWLVPELLPQSGPMMLLDDLVDAGEGWVTAGVRIAEDSLFFAPGVGMPCWLGLEYMAQTIALYSGLQATRAGRPVPIGLLLGSRRYQAMTTHFLLGSYLLIHVREQWYDGQIGAFDCSIEEDDRCLAQARLNVFLPPDAKALIERGQR
jgi:predicted hotdog family 3-hydroxylacyl-ACP dehydratase